jgi:capsular polysaccharide transport system permease protein
MFAEPENSSMPRIEPILAAVDSHPVTQPTPAAARARFPWFAALSFVLLVVAPMALGLWYLETRAADRYASRTAFSIRSNEETAPLEIFGAITRLGGSSTATDAQILYDFIQSQQIVRRIAARIDLAGLYAQRPRDLVYTLSQGNDQATGDAQQGKRTQDRGNAPIPAPARPVFFH